MTDTKDRKYVARMTAAAPDPGYYFDGEECRWTPDLNQATLYATVIDAAKGRHPALVEIVAVETMEGPPIVEHLDVATDATLGGDIIVFGCRCTQYLQPENRCGRWDSAETARSFGSVEAAITYLCDNPRGPVTLARRKVVGPTFQVVGVVR